MRALIFALALLASTAARAAITLDTSMCSGGTVANCIHEHISGTAAYTSGTSAAINVPTSISCGATGNILYARILDEDHSGGTTTGVPVIAAGTSGNYSTQWTLVSGSSTSSTSGSAAFYRAVCASSFSGEVPKLTLSCSGGAATCAGTNGAVGIEVHVQFWGFSAVFPTPGNASANNSASGTPSLTLTTTSGDKLLMGWSDFTGGSCSQTLTSGAAVVDAWEPGQVSPIVGCNGGADDYYVSEWTSGTTSAGSTTIGVTSPTTVTGAWTAIEICDSTASACPNSGTTQTGWWNWGGP